YAVKLGGVTVEAMHFGRSHTSGDSIVYFRDLKVVALSDAVTTGATGPLVDYAGGGSALEWKHVFEELLKLDFDAAIPGNGPVLTRKCGAGASDGFSNTDHATLAVSWSALVSSGSATFSFWLGRISGCEMICAPSTDRFTILIVDPSASAFARS